jgi:hypothetical protein
MRLSGSHPGVVGRWQLALRRIALWLVTAMSIAGCGLFGDEDEELQPTELLDFEQTLEVRRLWSTKVGDGTEFLRIALMAKSVPTIPKTEIVSGALRSTQCCQRVRVSARDSSSLPAMTVT